MEDKYFTIIMLIERLHRLFLDVVKAEVERHQFTDINNVQCLILYNVGKSKMSVGEVSNRGYYLGSNVTYNLKKLVENGYLHQEQSLHDKRSSQVWLTEKGIKLYDHLAAMIKRHVQNLSRNNIEDKDLAHLLSTMENLENFWSFMVTRELRF